MNALRANNSSTRFFEISRNLLGATVWCSALIFGCYILVFYALASLGDGAEQWNQVLPGLYDAENAGSTAGIAVHFLAGGVILVLGCLQLLEGVRRRFPALHRCSGRVYVLACVLAAVGGLVFIMLKGTIGGLMMDIGFAGYGLLMLLAAVQTIRFARRREFKRHRAWALRLFALAVGSWLYRMYYGFYIGFGGESGHTGDFRGWFDYLMNFWFYLPNLVVVEIILAQYSIFRRPWARLTSGTALLIANVLILFASFFFVRDYWGPGIVGAFAGS
ncbi:MAG: DUF2306 domain-containing protein [Granulosicoccus sp.]